jgi:hypothetical protein
VNNTIMNLLTKVNQKKVNIDDPYKQIYGPSVTEFGMSANELLIIRNECQRLYENALKARTWSRLSLGATWANAFIVLILYGLVLIPLNGVYEDIIKCDVSWKLFPFIASTVIMVTTICVAIYDTIILKRRTKRRLLRIMDYMNAINERHRTIKFVYSLEDPTILCIEFYKEIVVNPEWKNVECDFYNEMIEISK